MCTATLEEAIKGHNPVGVRWLWKNNCPRSEKLHLFTIRHGELSTLYWLHHQKGLQRDCVVCQSENVAVSMWSQERIYKEIVCKDHRIVALWLHKYAYLDDHDLLCEKAAQEGNLTVLQYLYKKDTLTSELLYVGAARNGHLNILLWLHDQKIPIPAAIVLVCRHQPHVLHWLRSSGCALPVSDDVVTTADQPE